ncbi:hypothetical protein CONLIGDRAFT_555621, partial [Coniochaeta ligniaria NRRL 30616]
VDRILEPQTIAHFLTFLCVGVLPSGRRTSLPLPSEAEVRDNLCSQPYSVWAPHPFSADAEVPVRHVWDHIGSFADAGRLHCVAKELHAMKSRLWEGIVPVSERRWRERGLDDPRNFGAACQLLSAVVNVFHYLNHERVRRDLRETYNRIWERLGTFETALNLTRAREGRGPVSVTALWAEFMRDHYKVMVERAYSWVVDRVERLQGPILDALGSHQPATPPISGPQGVADLRDHFDEVQRELTDKLDDLTDIRTHADFAIFVPLDGYKGCPEAAAEESNEDDELQATGLRPLTFTPDPEKRRERYSARVKVLFRENIMATVLMGDFLRFATTGTIAGGLRALHNGPARMRISAEEHVRAQEKAGREMRGMGPGWDGAEAWVRGLRGIEDWGFVCYRVAERGGGAWGEFRKRFEGDVAVWGEELGGVEAIRGLPMFHWVDAREHGLGGDAEGLRKHFATFVKSADFPARFHASIFLVADEHTVQSYMDPLPESMPPGDNGGSILAVDADFDPSADDNEWPGYDGTLRVLGSLLWDELSVFLLRGTYRLQEMWPLAMKHPWGVYTG